MTITILSHPDCVLHDMGTSHPECPERVQVIDHALKHSDIKHQLQFIDANLATREQLQRAHDPNYIEAIFAVAPQQGIVALDPDTAMNQYTLQAALRSAGAGVQAVDLVMSGQHKIVFCNIRPPGHHATYAQAMGFCFFNNIAVAVAHAFSQYDLQRIAIIDFDVHHGNGTEDIFREDERVMLCSSFQSPFYPYSGEDTVSNHILNVPLAAGTDGQEYRRLVTEHWLKQIDAFKPELIFFSAGFDAHERDVLANIGLQEADYQWISSVMRDLANKHAQGRMISMLEGGYALDVLGKCAVAHLRGLLGT